MRRRDELTVKEIARRLGADVVGLCDAIGIVGRRRGHEFEGLRKREGGLGDSFSIRLDGPKAGVWAHHSAGQSGDAIDLVEYMLGLDKGGAVQWAKRFLGIEGAPLDAAPSPARPAVDPELVKRQVEAETEKLRGLALSIWHGSIEPYGTLAEAYLRHRGYRGNLPVTIRYHKGLRHPERGEGERFPCLVAARCDVGAKIRGIWRIYLGRDGRKLACVEKSKLGLGSVPGGAVRLAPRLACINVAEGVETALAVLQLCPGACVWAALSTSGMGRLEWPPGTHELVIWADYDPKVEAAGPMQGKRPGWLAAQELAGRARLAGLRVAIVHPGTGEGTDFADIFKQGE